ncbi:MAG: histidine kinase [Flavobacteriales bacterium]|nr:histidine kinase [Flavobacteriales bacterium]
MLQPASYYYNKMIFHNGLYQKKAQLRLCFFFLYGLLCLSGYSQNQPVIDSLEKYLTRTNEDTDRVNTTYELAIQHLYYDQEKTQHYTEQTLELAKELHYNRGIAMGYACKGHLGNVYANYDQAVQFYLKSIGLFEKMHDKRFLGNLYSYLGDVYDYMSWDELNQNNEHYIQKSIEYHVQSIYYLEQTHDSTNLGRSFVSLGNAYVNNKNYNLAIQHYSKSFEIARSSHDTHTQVAAGIGLAGAYYSLKDYRKAIDTYQQTLASIPDAREYKRSTSSLLHDMAKPYLELKAYDKAIEALDSSLAIAQKEQDNRLIRMAYSGLDLVYYTMGDLEKAYEAYNKWVELELDQLNATTQNRINELQEEFQGEKKELEIQRLNLEKEQLSTKLKARNIIIALSVSILILLVLLIIFYLKQRKIRELQKQAELEQKALRAQMNPHFIFNSLSNIQHMIMEGKTEQANDFIGDFGQLLRTVLEKSGSSKISINDELETLKLYLDLENERTGGMIEYNIELDNRIDLLHDLVPPLILQPFVENAIWHGILPTGKNGKIDIRITKEKDSTLICTITDNGIGIDKSKASKTNQKHKSQGMEITAARLNINNAVTAEEREEGGTTVTLLIPLNP